MKTSIIVDFDRGPLVITAKVSGVVTQHHGRLHLNEFETDMDLRPAEIEAAQDRIVDHARAYGHIVEMEPDARVWGGNKY